MSISGGKIGKLLSLFLEELSHEIRTPLSVMSNELFLLKESSQSASIASQKAFDISNCLSELTQIQKMVSESDDPKEALASFISAKLIDGGLASAQSALFREDGDIFIPLTADISKFEDLNALHHLSPVFVGKKSILALLDISLISFGFKVVVEKLTEGSALKIS